MVAAPRRRSGQRSAALERATALRETGPNMRIAVVVMLVTACGPVRADDGQPGQPDGPTSPGSDAPGGGSGSDPLADYRSGTRIKMQVLTTPDGAKQFQGWFDTQRNEACFFAQASDGVMRCLPNPAPSSLFADSSCSVPAAQVPQATAACTKYVAASVTFTATCPQMVNYGAIFPASVVNPTPNVFVKSGAACVASTVLSGFVVVAVAGPEIPPSSFQSATLAVE